MAEDRAAECGAVLCGRPIGLCTRAVAGGLVPLARSLDDGRDSNKTRPPTMAKATAAPMAASQRRPARTLGQPRQMVWFHPRCKARWFPPGLPAGNGSVAGLGLIGAAPLADSDRASRGCREAGSPVQSSAGRRSRVWLSLASRCAGRLRALSPELST